MDIITAHRSTVLIIENTLRPTPPLPLAALAYNLQRLCWIRLIVLAFIAFACVYAWLELDMAERMPSIGAVVGGMLFVTFVAALRLHWGTAISELEFFLHLVADVLLLGFLVYLTGGATNPFVSYFLVPLCVAAATLPWLYAVAIAALEVAAYTLLLFFYVPLPFFSHGGGEHMAHAGVNAHYLGMWFNFFVSAVIIAWFVAKMAENLRSQEEQIQQQQQLRREQQLHDEQILSIASLAAGTAHELGTPVNSLKLLLGELERSGDTSESAALQSDIALMKTQIDQCEASLKKLVSTARQTQPGELYQVPLGSWLLQCVQRWQPLRPDATVTVLFNPDEFTRQIQCDETLQQAVANLLNNAANASPDHVEIDLAIDANPGRAQNPDATNYARVIIRDSGPGIDQAILSNPAAGIVRKQPGDMRAGLGMGVFLSNANINRLGGELLLDNRVDPESRKVCGAEVTVLLPLLENGKGGT